MLTVEREAIRKEIYMGLAVAVLGSLRAESRPDELCSPLGRSQETEGVRHHRSFV